MLYNFVASIGGRGGSLLDGGMGQAVYHKLPGCPVRGSDFEAIAELGQRTARWRQSVAPVAVLHMALSAGQNQAVLRITAGIANILMSLLQVDNGL